MLMFIPLVLFLSLALACYHCTADDAFISFRCARNLAQGAGPVYNVGERVEVFSNPLWVLVLALASLVRIDIVTASKIIGLGCGAATLFFLMRLCRRVLALSPVGTLLALCYAAASIGFVFYAISGMETALYTMTLVLMVYLLSERREMLAAVSCALLVLTRPEGILYGVPLAIGCFLNGRRFRRVLAVLAIPVAVYGLLASFRLIYFGTLFPNSFNAKIESAPLSFGSLSLRMRCFAQYTWGSLTGDGPVLTLALAGVCMLFRRRLVPLLASVGVAAFFVWYSKGDWMGFWRFYAPVLPFLVMLWAGGLEFSWSRGRRSWKMMAVAAVFLVPLILSVARTALSIDRLSTGERFNNDLSSISNVPIGKYLASVGSPSDVIVVTSMGAVGYYSNCIIVDMLGLTDPKVPALMRQRDLRAYADYMLGREPTFIMLHNETPGAAPLQPLHAAIYERMRETDLYREDREFHLMKGKNLMLFVREKGDSPK